MTVHRRRQLMGVLLAVAVLGMVARQLGRDWQSLGQAGGLSVFHLDPRPLVLAWLLQTVGWLVVVDTWGRVLGDLGGRLPFARHLQLYTYTALAQVLPGSIWVPAGRLAVYRREGVALVAIGSALVVEWILLGVAGLVLYGLAAPFALAVPPRWAPLVAAAGLAAAAFLHPAVFRQAVVWAARALGRSTPPPQLTGRQLRRWFARELVVLALSGLALYLVMRAVGPTASLADAVGASAWTLAVANLLAWLPLTAVLKDGGMVLLLAPLYGSSVVALGVVIAWRMWLSMVGLSWAGLATLAAARGGS